jgi:hypothetical protein
MIRCIVPISQDLIFRPYTILNTFFPVTDKSRCLRYIIGLSRSSLISVVVLYIVELVPIHNIHEMFAAKVKNQQLINPLNSSISSDWAGQWKLAGYEPLSDVR